MFLSLFFLNYCAAGRCKTWFYLFCLAINNRSGTFLKSKPLQAISANTIFFTRELLKLPSIQLVVFSFNSRALSWRRRLHCSLSLYWKLQISNFKLQITNCILQIANCILQIANSQLQIAKQIVNCKLPIANFQSLMTISHFMTRFFLTNLGFVSQLH